MSENMNEQLTAKLTPVKFIETKFAGQGSKGLNQIILRLPIKTEEYPAGICEDQRFYTMVTVLGFHVMRYLLRRRSSPRRYDFVEYALGFGGLPKARFKDSGERVNAFDSLEAIKYREAKGDYSILREEYRSAPVEAKIYVEPNSVLCEYQCTDEQRKDENGVLRDEVRIIAKVTVPENSVHVDFILRNFSIKHAA